MTKRASRKRKQSYTPITLSLIVGSTLATLAGARLLAAEDGAAVSAMQTDNAIVQQIEIPPINMGSGTTNRSQDELLIDLPPIPTVVNVQTQNFVPAPVARSRSSR